MVQFDSLRSEAPPDDLQTLFKNEVEQLSPHALPLQQGLEHSSVVSDEPIKTVVMSMTSTASTIEVRAGVFYSGIISGCSCADDPTPIHTIQEYCELLFMVDRKNGNTTVTLVDE